MNVLIIDYRGDSKAWMEVYCKKELNVIYTITPEEKSLKNFLEPREYDAILVFETVEKQFSSMAGLYEIEEERIIYARNVESWLAHKWAVYALLNENNSLFRLLDYFSEKQKRKYTVSTVEDISYVGYSSDTTIMLNMHRLQENWSKLEMDIFHALANNFYDLSGKKYFLDIGANIGTTSIYFKKKIDSDIKVIAFEPDPETYKLLRANFILNEMPDDSIVENYGLADQESNLMLYRSNDNPGANSVLAHYDDDAVSTHMLRLDDYIERKGINPAEIKYMWIDVEGYEAQMLFGAKKIITTQKVPLYMEWNPQAYVFTNTFDDLVNFLVENFKGYVDAKEVREGNISVHKVTDLWAYKGSEDQRDIFFIK